MYSSELIDSLPLWLLLIITVAVIFLSIEVGWRIGIHVYRKSAKEKDISSNLVVGATLGLLSLLIAFTFGMAASRFDNRKEMVLTEANSIGTAYLRTDFLPEQSRNEARLLLREFAALRSGGAASIMSTQGLAKAGELEDRLWRIATDAVKKSDSISTGLLIQSLNDMIDLDQARVTALRNRLPDSIWLMLFLVSIFFMATLGYEFGLTGSRKWTNTILLVITVTTVFFLIADLDMPQRGLVQISQQPLFDLLGKISGP